jgi:hypothetical protein
MDFFFVEIKKEAEQTVEVEQPMDFSLTQVERGFFDV